MTMHIAGSQTLRLAVCLVLGAAAPLAVAAQETGALEEIIVTAQKREQSIADIPMSITALSTDEMKLSGAESIEDLQFKVPGFSLVNFYPGGQQYQLRGISSNQGLPTVGIYVDEMPINTDVANGNLDIDLRDLKRVEVLRGPQGTLYGEGSMGGTIKYVTTSPRLDAYEGSVGAQYGYVTDGSANWEMSGVANLPLIQDVFGVRVVASYADTGGWIDNVPLGRDDINSGSRLNVRAKALWQPSASTAASLLYMRGDVDVDNGNFSVEDRQTFTPVPSPIADKYDLFNLVLSHDTGSIQLLNSTGYIDRTSATQVDLSAVYVPFLETPPPFGVGLPSGTFSGVGAVTTADYKILTNELRLSSTGNGRFRWTVGAYYRDYESRATTATFEEPVALANVIGVPGFELLVANIGNDSTAWAAFGEGSYAITPQLELTLGARYYEDDRSQNSRSTNFGTSSVDVNEATFHSFNPKLALLFRFAEGSSIYANVAKGFRSGGFNLQSSGFGAPVPPTYDPESLWTYEIGGVLSAAPSKLQLQWAVYYNDWKDVQTFGFLTGLPITVLVNGGAASGFGVDLQATYLPTESLELSAAVGWNDMEYDSTTADHQPGDPMDFVAPLTAALTATYRFSAGEALQSYVRGEVQYTDSYDVNIRNFLAAAVSSEARTLVRLAYGLTKEAWEAQLFVDNLLDEDRIAMPAYGSLSEPIRTLPRTVGLNLTYHF